MQATASTTTQVENAIAQTETLIRTSESSYRLHKHTVGTELRSNGNKSATYTQREEEPTFVSEGLISHDSNNIFHKMQ